MVKALFGKGKKPRNIAGTPAPQFRNAMKAGTATNNYRIQGIFGYHSEIGELLPIFEGGIDHRHGFKSMRNLEIPVFSRQERKKWSY